MMTASRGNPAPTKAEREHILRVKSLPCSVCDRAGPSECHEIRQGEWCLAVALCVDCHRNAFLGIHGQRRNWAIRKVDELDALEITIRRMLGNVREWV